MSGEKAKDMLLQQAKELKLHLFAKKHQHEQFCENYDNKQQQKTQSTYFGYQFFSLYTVCTYYNEKGIVKVEKLVLITPTTEHSRKIT